MVAIPVNKTLYEKVKREAKQKFAVWPSAYASGWLVKTYKARGGTYREGKGDDSPKKPTVAPLARWYDEKWIDVCEYLETGKWTSCGRPHATESGASRDYPYCRPRVRVSKDTPKTVAEISRSELQRRCRKKKVGKSSVRVGSIKKSSSDK